jgi:hypothetical protein
LAATDELGFGAIAVGDKGTGSRGITESCG